MWGSKERNCRKKKAYSENEAIRAVEKYKKCNNLNQSAYKCEICGKWHLMTDKRLTSS